MKNIGNVFDGSKEKQILISALEHIDESISRLRNISRDGRSSLKIRISLEDLEWEREKLMDKISKLN